MKQKLEKMLEKKKLNNAKEKIYRCDNWYIARQQRENETKRGLALENTKGFENTGCYECFGVNQSCDRYSDILQISLLDKKYNRLYDSSNIKITNSGGKNDN